MEGTTGTWVTTFTWNCGSALSFPAGSPTTWTLSVVALVAGNYTVTVRAIDAAGNFDASQPWINFVVADDEGRHPPTLGKLARHGFRERDVVIVGGGHNGLACAAYLARAGLDVLVLERRGVLGGAAVTEEPWPGYQISSASYVVSLMPPRIVDELELKRFGYDVSIITPDYFVPFPDGTSLTLWGDSARHGEHRDSSRRTTPRRTSRSTPTSSASPSS